MFLKEAKIKNLPNIAVFLPFFSSNGGGGGRASDWGPNAPLDAATS